LHKEIEQGPEASKFTADLKKGKVGLINLQVLFFVIVNQNLMSKFGKSTFRLT